MLHGVYPNVPLEVLPAPYGLAQSAALRREVARTCMEREWDIALLCVGCPAQALIAQQLGELGRKAGIALCVGASIDFLVGKRSRAPLWLQRLGLEWAYRLACEPARLWRRYLVESPRFFRIFMATRALRGRCFPVNEGADSRARPAHRGSAGKACSRPGPPPRSRAAALARSRSSSAGRRHRAWQRSASRCARASRARPAGAFPRSTFDHKARSCAACRDRLRLH